MLNILFIIINYLYLYYEKHFLPFYFSDYLYRFISLTLTATLPYDGEVVRHLCNNRMCIRPDHLKIGSSGENKMDDILNVYAGGTNKDA